MVVGFGGDEPRQLVRTWAAGPAAAIDPAAYWQAHAEAGIGVAAVGSSAFPAPLAADDDPPAVVFWQGDLDHLAGVRVAIVGTRTATRYGLDVAFELGRDLSAAGVAVVSGLALGIDGAAHAGALDARRRRRPVAVVGSGLDVVYPRRHGPLWRAGGAPRRGAESEYPLGARPAAWRFPARNRIIAALADVVVVVESQATGGAMRTAVEAARRGARSWPCPARSPQPASDGTNRSCSTAARPPVTRPTSCWRWAASRPARGGPPSDDPLPAGDAGTVLAEAVGWQPVAVETLALTTGLDLGRLALALDQLEADGWIAPRAGWIERLGRPAGSR